MDVFMFVGGLKTQLVPVGGAAIGKAAIKGCWYCGKDNVCQYH